MSLSGGIEVDSGESRYDEHEIDKASGLSLAAKIKTLDEFCKRNGVLTLAVNTY